MWGCRVVRVEDLGLRVRNLGLRVSSSVVEGARGWGCRLQRVGLGVTLLG